MIRGQSCPICGRQQVGTAAPSRQFVPFCSARCRDIDLLRWSQGRYAIVDQLSPEEAELMQHDPDISVADDESV